MADRRLREADALLIAGEWSGAYYLSGYASECALKACVLRDIKPYCMPDKNLIADSYTHDLPRLLRLAGLSQAHEREARDNKAFAANWATVKDWNEASRYETWSEAQARDLVEATTETGSGVFRWIRGRW